MDETSHNNKKKKKKKKREKKRKDVTHVFDQLKNKIKNICGTY